MISDAERRALTGQILAATGMKIDVDDPVFILVLLNEIALKNEREKSAQAIEAAAQKLEATFTAQVDVFIEVANECLGKFQRQTGLLIEAIEKAGSLEQKAAPQKTIQHRQAATKTAPQKTNTKAEVFKNLVYVYAFATTLAIFGILFYKLISS